MTEGGEEPGEVKNSGRHLVIPHIAMLSKDFVAARRLLEERDELYKKIYSLPRCHRGDTLPGRTALSLFLGTLEHNVLLSLLLSLKPIPGVTVRALVFDGLIATAARSKAAVAEHACQDVIAAVSAQYGVRIARKLVPSSPLFRQYRFFRAFYSSGSTAPTESPMLRVSGAEENCLPIAIAAYILDMGMTVPESGLMEMVAGPYTCNDVVAKCPHVRIGEPLCVRGFQGGLGESDATSPRLIKEEGAYVLMVESHSIVLRYSLDDTVRMYDGSCSHLHTGTLDGILRVIDERQDCAFAILPLSIQESPGTHTPPPGGIRAEARLGLTLGVLLETCCVCSRRLTACPGVQCTIVGIDGVLEGFSERKRCCAKNCRIYYYPTFYWHNGEMTNTVENYGGAGSEHHVLFVSSKLGFTVNYIRSHYCRIMRGMSTRGEVETLQEVYGSGDLSADYVCRKFQDALYLHMRLLDQTSGVDDSGPFFKVLAAADSSPLYGGKSDRFEDGYLIFDSVRDTPWTKCEFCAVGISSDGNQKLVRLLTEFEKKNPKLGKTGVRAKAGSAARTDSCRKTTRGREGSKDKVMRRAMCFTSGLFVTVRANNPSNGPVVIREIREMINSESHLHREGAVRNCAKSGVLRVWIHDVACTCGWAQLMRNPPKIFLDRFHQRNHVRSRCMRSLNPSWGRNRPFLEKLGIRNASASEQTNAVLKKCAPYSRKLSRSRYRCFWRHYAICQNRKK